MRYNIYIYIYMSLGAKGLTRSSIFFFFFWYYNIRILVTAVFE